MKTSAMGRFWAGVAARRGWRRWVRTQASVVAGLGLAAGWMVGCGKGDLVLSDSDPEGITNRAAAVSSSADPESRQRGGTAAAAEPTYYRDVAPILHRHCAGCHRPGQTGPFDLLTYEDARKRSETVVEVTRTRYMPPWLPEPGHEPLVDERRLSDDEILVLERWVRGGMPEGDAATAPPPPRWSEGWVLGTPDLVVRLSEAYVLPAEGEDVYRNFVVPVPTRDRRWVRAFEFRPGSRAVHHAFLRIDGTGQSRRMDEREPGLGFGGMNTPPAAETPGGYFLSWQPGRLPAALPSGLSWSLPAGADVVLLMHMQLLGAPEPVQPSIGFYFTDVPPVSTPIKIGLRSYTLDIPAGESSYTVEERVTLPVESELLAVLPHAHYLARRVEAFVELPGGARRSLLVIPSWDFNWQSDFRFSRPVGLPAGAILGMRFVFDNSTNNLRNPNRPPERVTFGLRTRDEMGEMWWQLLARDRAGREALERVAQLRLLRDIEELSRFQLRQNPEDAEAMGELAKVALSRGDVGRADQILRRALMLRPDLSDLQYHLGLVLLEQRRFGAAEGAFLESLRLNPENYPARNNAGIACLRQGRFQDAAAHFREVLRLRPGDTAARENLELSIRGAGRSR